MKAKIDQSDLICLKCGNITSIQRRKSNKKKTLHIKHLYCYKCMDVTRHAELIDASIFKRKLDNKESLDEIEYKLYKLLNTNLDGDCNYVDSNDKTKVKGLKK